MNIRKPILIATIGVAAAAVFGVTAFASLGGGFTPGPQVRGTIGAVHLNADRIKFQLKDDTDVVAQTITYAPGGFSGWHTHPGFVLVVVESGAMTIQVGCSISTHPAGTAFEESGTTPIMARNLGTVPAILHVTYVVPKSAPARREVALADAPAC